MSSSSAEDASSRLQDGKADSTPITTFVDDALSLPQIRDSELQIWAVNISSHATFVDELQLQVLVDSLLPGQANAGDRAKVMRYFRQVDRVRSLVARLLPRLLIAHRFGVAWDGIQFGATKGRSAFPYRSSVALEGGLQSVT